MPTAFRTMLNPDAGDTDPYFSSVSLLLHMDGTNGSTTFIDSGPNALAVTAVGSASISTSGPKWGTGAADFDGNGDSLTIAANSVFAFGTGDFTIEGWFYSRTTGSSQRGMIDFRTTASGTNGIMLREDGTAGFLVWLNNGTLLSTATGRIANTWQHVALVRSGTTITLFVDGVSKASATSSADMTDNRFRLSGFVDVQDATFTYNGKVDDVRITKVARTISVPTAAFPDLYNPYTTLPVSGAALWLSAPQTSSLYTDAGATNVIKAGDAVYQWNDLSGNNRHATQTTSGNRPTWVAPASGRNGLGAVSFNGTSNFIDRSATAATQFSGDFTVEFWIKLNSAVQQSIFDTRVSETSPYGNGFVISATSSNVFQFYQGSTRISSSAVSTGTWNHIAVCRSGSSIRMFLNGTQTGSTYTSSMNFSDGGFLIGTDYPRNARWFNGQIQNLLIYNGQALYTSNFTPWMS